MNAVKVGQEWVYRLRDDSPSEHVRILAIRKQKQSFRADVEFLDGAKCGAREDVPGRRLRSLWSDAENYNRLMSNWERLRDCELTSPEAGASEEVFIALIPRDIAEMEWSPVDGMTVIHRRDALAELMTEPLSFVEERCSSFDHEGKTMLSPRGTLLIAELACRKNPMPILDAVMNEEKAARHYSKHGRTTKGLRGQEDEVRTADQEHDSYKRWVRPRHEVLRQWCGHRAATLQERLIAAESEVQRLDELLTTALNHLDAAGDESGAKWITRAHVEDRITPQNIRPVVERPLAWWDVPQGPPDRRFRRRWW
ncbi:MAG: hypothetical protein U5O16_38250 [Rhodococcus sp. (in: high G+C Gram-positive bacteria)]|uniref:hypothetical protein n=1 Tax=Rhodococcus sp. TaxID=1831 RepID=UPI002ADA1AAD|nr:hypothetical protein [Rhodococcus sp. (in: high G+C Gram-positive bacteria)]